MAGKLTTLKLRSLTKPGRYGDGDGLWLQVKKPAKQAEGKPEKAPARSWLFRYMLAGRARQMGLGAVEEVSLAEARDAAHAARKLVRANVDPIKHRDDAEAAKAVVAKVKTFKEVVDMYVAAHEASWRNPKHRWQWGASLEKHAYPVLEQLPVDKIGTGHVMEVLEPIWQTLPETASRVRGRIESVLDYAKSRDWRRGENPARWRGHVANMLPKRNKARSVQHHPALPWSKMGAFMAALRAETSLAALALEFTILTAARTGEAIGARWQEIDLKEKVWTVPGDRMKAAKEHRVPLSDAAVAVLNRAAKVRTDDGGAAYVFPGKPKKPLSNMAMAMLLRRMNATPKGAPEGTPPPWRDARGDAIVPHGFRSAFRDWASETTAYPREVAEAALAHTVADQVEAAYRRGDLFEKRRALMDDWAKYCGRSPIVRRSMPALLAS